MQAVTLELRWRRFGHDLLVTGAGIIHRQLDGLEISDIPVPWLNSAKPTWMEEDWLPLPRVRAAASTEMADVVIVDMASLLALGVRVQGRSTWYSIVPSPNAASATTLARSAGLGDADDVSVFTDPAKILRSTIVNATDIALTIEPMVEFASRSRGPSRILIADQALSSWQSTSQIRVPKLNRLPNELCLDLVRAFDHRPSHAVLQIGATVEEVAKTDSGQSWQFDVLLSPGEIDARRFDSKTMRRRDEGVLDREGHFGVGDTRCPYCKDRMCALCTNGLKSCDCCGISICRTCIREPQADLWLCPACEGMRLPLRSEAREHGRFMFKGRMLIGTDDEHVVVVERSKKSWIRHREDGQNQPLANPSLTSYLVERLSGRTTNSANE